MKFYITSPILQKFSVAIIILNSVQKWWKEWNLARRSGNNLYWSFLSHFIHLTNYKKFCSSTSNLTWTHIGQWLKFYFESWFNSKPKSILAELIKYKKEEDPYNIDFFNQFEGNLVDFWESTCGIGPELACVAIWINVFCVISASVKRLWSSMGYFHTNRRNRLKVIFFSYF